MTLRRLFLLFLVAVITFTIGVVAAAVTGGFTPLVKFGRREHRYHHTSRRVVVSPSVTEANEIESSIVTTTVDSEGCRHVVVHRKGIWIETGGGGRVAEAGELVGTNESTSPPKK